MRETARARILEALNRQIRRSRSRTPARFEGDFFLRRSGSFAIVGDLQRTSLAEIWRESNRDEREWVVRQIAERSPDFLVSVGDLVFCGSSRVDWQEFDELSAPLRDAGIPVLPVLGNHEYWVAKKAALRNYFARFPHLEGRHWYSITYGALGLVFLDSNESPLGARGWSEESGWFARELERLDLQPEVKGILVFVHHPPYTNSTVTRDELHVQRAFVPAFLKARKTMAMVSGHVHSYEHFERDGRTFLVTGGGGGPRARLSTGTRRRHVEEVFDGPTLRSFHFLMCRPSEGGLEVEIEALSKQKAAFETLTRFTLRWPHGGTHPPSPPVSGST